MYGNICCLFTWKREFLCAYVQSSINIPWLSWIWLWNYAYFNIIGSWDQRVYQKKKGDHQNGSNHDKRLLIEFFGKLYLSTKTLGPFKIINVLSSIGLNMILRVTSFYSSKEIPYICISHDAFFPTEVEERKDLDIQHWRYAKIKFQYSPLPSSHSLPFLTIQNQSSINCKKNTHTLLRQSHTYICTNKHIQFIDRFPSTH